MTRNGAAFLVAIAATLGGGILLAQERAGAPGTSSGGLAIQCAKALESKEYLRDLKVRCREEGSGRIVCEGAVPAKAHACAIFLTCMGIHGVAQVDLAKLRIDHWLDEPKPVPGEKAPARTATPAEKLSLYAVVIEPADTGIKTAPGSTPVFKNDVIVVGEVPVSLLPGHQPATEYPSGNPANSHGQPESGIAPEQPVAPHNPGAFPNTDPGKPGGP
jgi:hypothetical protein